MATYESLSDLANRTQNQLIAGIIEEIFVPDESFALMPVIITDRPTIQYNREATIGTAEVIDCTSTLTSVAISAAPVTTSLLTVHRQFDVCRIGQDLYSSFDVNMAILLTLSLIVLSMENL